MADVINYTALSNLTAWLITSANKYIGFGTGASAAARGNTSLSTEAYSSTNDGTHNTRPAGTQTQQTTTNTHDTYQCAGTLTCNQGGGLAITNAGIFDTNGQAADLVTAPSGGNLFVSSSFSVINLSNGDAIQLTFAYQLT